MLFQSFLDLRIFTNLRGSNFVKLQVASSEIVFSLSKSVKNCIKPPKLIFSKEYLCLMIPHFSEEQQVYMPQYRETSFLLRKCFFKVGKMFL